MSHTYVKATQGIFLTHMSVLKWIWIVNKKMPRFNVSLSFELCEGLKILVFEKNYFLNKSALVLHGGLKGNLKFAFRK